LAGKRFLKIVKSNFRQLLNRWSATSCARWASLVILSVVIPAAAIASIKSAREIIIGKSAVILHGDYNFTLGGKRVPLDNPDAIDTQADGHPFATDVDDHLIERLTGLARNPFIVRRSTGLKNGFAVIVGQDRVIVYDPLWYSPLSQPIGGTTLLVLAHEIGHHICRHTAGSMRERPWDKELEADRYAGSLMRRAGFDELTMRFHVDRTAQTYSADGSSSHPPRALRIKAYWEGYRNGSNCSNG